eukprot:4562059-Lingulodinium_polyedra.AAC.1
MPDALGDAETRTHLQVLESVPRRTISPASTWTTTGLAPKTAAQAGVLKLQGSGLIHGAEH